MEGVLPPLPNCSYPLQCSAWTCRRSEDINLATWWLMLKRARGIPSTLQACGTKSSCHSIASALAPGQCTRMCSHWSKARNPAWWHIGQRSCSSSVEKGMPSISSELHPDMRKCSPNAPGAFNQDGEWWNEKCSLPLISTVLCQVV